MVVKAYGFCRMDAVVCMHRNASLYGQAGLTQLAYRMVGKVFMWLSNLSFAHRYSNILPSFQPGCGEVR